MTILLTGAKGMLAADIKRSMPTGMTVIETDVEELDITDSGAVAVFCGEHTPELILNCAAYTAVDAAETDRDAAYAVNETGPQVLASVCAQHGIPLVHISTDFVFFGEGDRPMREDDQTAPRGIYAQSKRAGEIAIEKAGCAYLIVRTSWLYGAAGRNFPDTMLKLGLERNRLTVVNDQTGSPTYSPDLARAVWNLIDSGATGYVHFSNSGACTWYDFAIETIKLGKEYSLLPADKDIEVVPVTSEEFVRPAPRPAYSVMDTEKYTKLTGAPPRPWQEGLRDYIAAKRTGIITAVCISVKRGTRKAPVVAAFCREDHGIDGDAHAGPGDRQVSFLSSADIKSMEQLGITLKPGDFAENIIIDGMLLDTVKPGDVLQVEDGPVCEVTVIGKDCHNAACPIKVQTGKCIMPEKGVFTRVIKSGKLRKGQAVSLVKK